MVEIRLIIAQHNFASGLTIICGYIRASSTWNEISCYLEHVTGGC